jgi:exopolysaccharide biosynthesis polyprenyl glycosylphosphotransferase
MNGGWQYRVAGVIGTAALALAAVSLAETALAQALFGLLPVVGHLPFDAPGSGGYYVEAGTAAIVLIGALAPLYKPRPRRILDIGLQALRRVVVALLALAAIGYFDLSFRLPRATLLVAGTFLLLAVPAWFVLIRRRPHPEGDRTVIIGDDPETMDDILEAIDGNVIGYVSPPSAYFTDRAPQLTTPELADGGVPQRLNELACLGGLSRLDEVLIEYDAGTAVLAFARPDREEFFGTLDTCYDHGVTAKVHRQHADVVLTGDVDGGELVDVDLDPWDWQEYVIKRAFDIAFAGVGLLVAAPLMAVIAVAIKLDSNGPVLYAQERTATFGETFTVYKFRSMVTDAEAETGVKLSEEDNGGRDPRVTRVGRVLRRTHLDEIPQLWSILRGDMSVVGPRPERPELDHDIEADVTAWRRRWFARPGLTGLAQINGATGYDPEEKLRYDVLYIREQSFWFDLKILVRQLWMVAIDAVYVIMGREPPGHN